MIFDLPFVPKVEVVDWQALLPLSYNLVVTNKKGWYVWDPQWVRRKWEEEDGRKGGGGGGGSTKA